MKIVEPPAASPEARLQLKQQPQAVPSPVVYQAPAKQEVPSPKAVVQQQPQAVPSPIEAVSATAPAPVVTPAPAPAPVEAENEEEYDEVPTAVYL